ncbi:hypothetical protein SFRURICE_017455 [Spodoptera frugiperda]|uniref:Uncharacterized protein LOC118277177 n=1 Tax=Spodoptera frugiperda TaxID=7108 RepID=A0A9R0DFT9_SPOFR|nr:uncharacterized protein LOC118277177 [Spodoptera frugiperda]KAF9794765.1 hypothetical protein SFRURICE_017455 [Spodoptera frugiperda]
MMKSLILVAVLAALAVFNDAATLQNGAFRANMYQGGIRPGDRLLHSNYYYKNPITNAVQYQDITYRGNASTRISYIQATEVGYTQWGIPSLRAGGVNYNYATIRLTSQRGYGYYYRVEIWGR